jgi:hypothetical protein
VTDDVIAMVAMPWDANTEPTAERRTATAANYFLAPCSDLSQTGR